MREHETMDASVVIVTGASSGIGAATALEFAARGRAVVLAARRAEKLDAVAERCRQAGAVGTLVVPTDVASRDQVDALVAAAVERFGRVDVMVNNAGHGVHARVHEVSDQQMREIMDVNFFGVFYGCRAIAQVMIRQGGGHIFNVSSVIGRRGCPFNGAYSASKFAVCGLSDALRVEMLPYNVRVTTVLPGLTRTDFFDHVRGGTSLHKTSFARVRGLMPPETVARRIARTVGRHKPEVVFSLGGKLLIWVHNRFPRLADRMMKLYHDDLVRAEQRDGEKP
ncbi:MAG: SDR family oxidoreductase [Phycisphaerae bacterium]|nr:SDR family oxidoreductase [Phycisphaerae bacterium]